MATVNPTTLVTYNAKTTYVASAGHNARLVAGIKQLTSNGTQAVTVAQLKQFCAAKFNNPQFVNYGLKMGKRPIITAPKSMQVAAIPTS